MKSKQKYFFFLLFFLTTATVVYPQITLTLDSTQVEIETVVDSGLCKIPWDILWGPDNRLWFTDSKEIKAWDPVSKNLKTLFTKTRGNALGIVTHPNFSTNPYVYIVYDTGCYYGHSSLCELYRYNYSTTGDSLYNETKLLEYPHAGEHAGARLVITQDSKLLLTTADYWYSTDTLGFKKGKVLRMNLDGTVPSDNPRADYTYSFGHRNPQGLVQTPNGKIYVSEHGQAGNNELNLIKKNVGYGWPVYDGNTCTNLVPDSCASLTFTYEKALLIKNTPVPSPSGMDYYNFNFIPEFTNSMLVGGLNAGSLLVWRLNTAGDSAVSSSSYWPSTLGRIRDVAVSPGGDIYLITNDRKNLLVNCASPIPPDGDARIRVLKKKIFPGISEEQVKKIKIYPNPVYDDIIIETADNNAEISIYAIDGKLLLKRVIVNNENVKLSTDDWVNGIYYLLLKNGDGQLIGREKIIKLGR